MTVKPSADMSADERLDSVARILAEGFIRHKLRHLRKMAQRDRGENSLEVSPGPRAHVLDPGTGEE